MKIIVDYNSSTGIITLSNGMTVFLAQDIPEGQLEKYESTTGNTDILALAKQGYSAKDLVELKKQDII